MAKRHRTWNEQKYRRYIKEGRGQGTLSAYKPWIMIHDFPSLGMVSRVLGSTTGRIHHLLSNMELSYFYILDWSDKVCDIREQYPLLDIAAVLEIADKAGIRYPFDNQSGFPYVLTSDFLITTPNGEMARSIKKKKDLDNPRVREKLEIERRYWAKYGVDWKLVTEDEINQQKARNIEWLFQASGLPETFGNLDFFEECLSCFEDIYFRTDYSILIVAKEVEHRCQLDAGMGIRVFQYLVQSKRIPFYIEGTLELNAAREHDSAGRAFSHG